MTDSTRKLRIGLLLGGQGLRVPQWVAHMVGRILQDGHADISLLVIDRTPAEPAGAPLSQRLRDEPAAALDDIVRRVLTRVLDRFGQHAPSGHDAFKPVDLEALLASVPRREVQVKRTRWSDRFADSDVEAIRAADLDVLVRVGFRILRGPILEAARCGIWSFHHGDNDVNRGGPPGYWEALQDWPVTGCTLQVLSEDLDNGIVLDKTWAQTQHRSVADNNRSTYSKSLSMLPRQLARLRRLGAEDFLAKAREARPHPQWYSRQLYRAPSTGELARLVLHRLARRVRKAWSTRVGFDQWALLLHRSDTLSLSLWRYRRLVPPKDRFWADPFLWSDGKRTWVFMEELMYETGRGHIAAAELHDDGTMGEPQPVVVEPHHLSYPFVFEHRGQVYMVPEARTSRSIPVYRCVEMPHRWERVGSLMDDVEAVDATLHEHEGRWWLFVNMIENPGGSSCDELFVFHSEDPLSGQWTPHPMNPVVSDVRRSRPAGRLFIHEGRLYRPSQDCGPRYGWGLNLQCVESLTPDDYREVLVSKAEPGWAPDARAVHTFNRLGRWHIADAQFRRSRWR